MLICVFLDDQYKSLTSQLCRNVNLDKHEHYVAVCYFVSDGKKHCDDCSDELFGFTSKVCFVIFFVFTN